ARVVGFHPVGVGGPWLHGRIGIVEGHAVSRRAASEFSKSTVSRLALDEVAGLVLGLVVEREVHTERIAGGSGRRKRRREKLTGDVDRTALNVSTVLGLVSAPNRYRIVRSLRAGVPRREKDATPLAGRGAAGDAFHNHALRGAVRSANLGPGVADRGVVGN